MKTKFALAFYYLAIGLLTACAITIVVKLIFWPPCTQTGNLCVIDGWSVAGLAGTVLAVAATVLAILGAVAVAAWWTSLNERVTDQVKKLYSEQKAEINIRVDQLVSDQQDKITKVSEQLDVLQKKLVPIEIHLNTTQAEMGKFTEEIDRLRQMARDVEDITIEGLMVIGAHPLEEWAQKAMQKYKFGTIPIKMVEGYLDVINDELTKAEEELRNDEKDLQHYEQVYQTIRSYSMGVSSAQSQLKNWLAKDDGKVKHSAKVLLYWEGANRWLALMQYGQENETQKQLTEKIEVYRPRIQQLRQLHEQVRERTLAFLLKADAAEKQQQEINKLTFHKSGPDDKQTLG
ncbi:MAG TPA: hypothetical protein VF043_39775 [Ktedonobacteraceae bacterium]